MTQGMTAKPLTRKAEQRAEMIERSLMWPRSCSPATACTASRSTTWRTGRGSSRTLLSYYFRDKKELFDKVFAPSGDRDQRDADARSRRI